jgi:hypothetical protein
MRAARWVQRKPAAKELSPMKTRHLLIKLSALGLSALGVCQLGSAAAEGQKSATDKQATTTEFSVTSLAVRRGPAPPVGATFVGVQSQPMVGELKLPIQNAKVYRFMTKTAAGKEIPVNWTYQPGTGTYMWGTTKIQCANSTQIANGGFAMQVHEDGSGAYALGTRKCPVAAIYGCKFDSTAVEQSCGLCAWNQTELACVSDKGD